jgi:phospholipid-transporting ATPase
LITTDNFTLAYIETAQLDGETNLKIRQALPKTAELTTVQQLNSIKATIECELPNRKVNEFTGTLQIGDDRLPLCLKQLPFIHCYHQFLAITQFLLRGAKLKNCKWIYGVIIYTGHDSRLLMNSTTAPLKRFFRKIKYSISRGFFFIN